VLKEKGESQRERKKEKETESSNVALFHPFPESPGSPLLPALTSCHLAVKLSLGNGANRQSSSEAQDGPKQILPSAHQKWRTRQLIVCHLINKSPQNMSSSPQIN